ncbi:MAG: Rossmann-like and DUF2520 domain-containing protein [Gemmatimonadota bacterium]
MTRSRWLVVGPGRAGCSLALALHGAGEAVELRGRRTGRPVCLRDAPGLAYRAGTHLRGDVDGSPPGPQLRLVLCVPDDALDGAAADWSRSLEDSLAPPDVGSHVALHTSGARSSDALAPLRRAGFAVGSAHPLTALTGPDPAALAGVPFALSGDDEAREAGGRLAELLGGRPIRIEEGEQARYHAAAVFGSNYVAACLAVAAEELGRATAGEAGLEELLPLARAALDGVERRGLPKGLTGPVARGDAGTVRRHLEALAPERAELYRRLARELLRVLDGPDPGGRAAELEAILGTDEIVT